MSDLPRDRKHVFDMPCQVPGIVVAVGFALDLNI